MVRTRHQRAEVPNSPSPTPVSRQRAKKRPTRVQTTVQDPVRQQVLPPHPPEIAAPTSQVETAQHALAQQLITLAQALSMPPANLQGNTNLHQDARPPTAKHIPPPKLSAPDGMNIIQYRDWKQRWRDFASTQQIQQYPLEAQHGILRAAIDSEWTMLWNSSRLKIKQDSTLPEILDLMETYIRNKRNPLLDRQEFHRRDQMAGESVDHYFAALRVLDDACGHEDELQCSTCSNTRVSQTGLCLCGAELELEKQLQDIRIRDRFICGLRDKSMQRRVLAEQYGSILTMDKVLSICTTVENSKAAGLSLSASRPTESEVYATTSSYKSQSKPAHPRNASTGDRFKCKWCGGTRHGYDHCPARNVKCNYCRRIGHLEAVCLQKTRGNIQRHGARLQTVTEEYSGAEIVTAPSMGNVTIFKAGKSENLLPLPTEIGDEIHMINWLPDTGAEVDAISIQDLKALGLKAQSVLTEEKQEVFAANGSSLGPVGSVPAIVRANNKCYQTTIRVFDKLTTPLLSKSGCISLGLIDANWPTSKIHIYDEDRNGARSISIGAPEVAASRKPDPDIQLIKEKLLQDLGQAFDDTTLRPMIGPPMKIDLLPNAQPCKRFKAYTVPFHWREQVKSQLEDMTKKGIIEPVPVGEAIDWCHPMVVVPKKGTAEPRITVDLTGLNKFVRRPVYPVKIPREVVARIPPGNKYFTTLDARHGYWQVPLDIESRKLTTFITPWGCFRYCRNVMGLISAGDEHNRRGDEAIKGINQVEKIVEDILIFDEDLESHTNRVRDVIKRCEEHHMTLNARKFTFAEHEVDWCGYRITEQGYTPAPHLIQALTQFPTPVSKTDVRSFCGLVQQFEAFSTRIAELSLPLRALLNKKVEFLWASVHQQAFEAVIRELSSSRVLAHYDPARPVRLETDGAQSKGLGFALWQQQEDSTWKLLQAGSRYVTPTEARYSATEIELLAVVWAVKKCRLYLMGNPFELVVDHRPLTSIINCKTLDEIENPRLQRLKEKLACYRPQVVWRAGKQHIVVDVFSRYPSSQPTAEDKEECDNYAINCAIRLQDQEDGSQILDDIIISSVRTAGSVCSEYGRLIKLIKAGFPHPKQNMDEDLRAFWNIRDELTVENGIVLFGTRIIIPLSLRHDVLKTLHAAHQGQERTLRRARQSVFWPNISNDIKNTVRSCNECASRLPSHQKEPLLEEAPSTYPLQCVGVDLFKYAGFEYLVMVDRFSGWINVAKCGHSATTSNVIYNLKRWMTDLGIPEKLVSDNGPQFASFEFKNWLKKWGIKHDPSSPYYPQANGLAEAGVKAASSLIAKTSPNGDLNFEAFQLGLLELRNTPRADGRSPAQLLFGHPIRSQLPLHRRFFAQQWRKQTGKADKRAIKLKEKAVQYYNSNAKPLGHLKCGETVRVQDPRTKEWSMVAEVIDVHPRGRSYTIRTESGRVFWRNRKFIRRFYPRQQVPECSPPQPPKELRRSTRRRLPPQRYAGVLKLDRRSSFPKGGHEVCSMALPLVPDRSQRQTTSTFLVDKPAEERSLDAACQS